MQHRGGPRPLSHPLGRVGGAGVDELAVGAVAAFDGPAAAVVDLPPAPPLAGRAIPPRPSLRREPVLVDEAEQRSARGRPEVAGPAPQEPGQWAVHAAAGRVVGVGRGELAGRPPRLEVGPGVVAELRHAGAPAWIGQLPPEPLGGPLAAVAAGSGESLEPGPELVEDRPEPVLRLGLGVGRRRRWFLGWLIVVGPPVWLRVVGP